MAGAKKLVMSASGFLGSHVTRQLVERGDDVRVILPRADPPLDPQGRAVLSGQPMQ